MGEAGGSPAARCLRGMDSAPRPGEPLRQLGRQLACKVPGAEASKYFCLLTYLRAEVPDDEGKSPRAEMRGTKRRSFQMV